MLKINGYILECHDENVFNELFIDFIEGHGWSFMGSIADDAVTYPKCSKEKQDLASEWISWYESIEGDCDCACLFCGYNTVCDDVIEDILL